VPEIDAAVNRFGSVAALDACTFAARLQGLSPHLSARRWASWGTWSSGMLDMRRA
jgi:hypothetical protein